MKPPKYKPERKLMYLNGKVGEQIVTVINWDEMANEYWCSSDLWGFGMHCQEKDLKPIEGEE